MTQESPAPAPESTAPARTGLVRYAVLVAAGAFATTFAQQRIVANLPTTFLLKDGFGLKKEEVAFFFFWATFAWNLKPVAGVLTDAFPLFGTRRRHYMLIGSVSAAVLWVVMGACSHQYTLLLGASIGMNIATVFSSTVMGGLMVEAGQLYGAPGRIASLRQVVQSIAIVIGPLLGGYLAGKAFGITTGIAAATVLSLAVLSYFVLQEKPVARGDVVIDPDRPRYKPSFGTVGGVLALGGLASFLFTTELRNVGISLFALTGVFILILVLAVVPAKNPVIVRAQGQLSQIFASKTLWMAVVMLFLVYTVPGLNTALVFQQSEVYKFDTEYIGFLGSVEGVVGIIAALAYGVVCRRFSLRTLIIGGVGLSGLTTYLYLFYGHDTAPFIHGAAGFFGVVAELCLMDLAVRSTPKGCEALGFSLMMSVRNFGLSMSDVIGTQIMDQFHVSFPTMVSVNATTTMVVLLFVPFLPRLVVGAKEGEKLAA